ncbi:hypothetical protein MN608_04165 [Microdochium nivale]|nr:hypothetical protein MN608_04165 [Microdochium nivale]
MRSHTLTVAAVMATTVASLASPTSNGRGGSKMLMALPRELHVFLPLEIRQGGVSPGQFACHEACGNAIVGATGDYCENPSWLARFDACMKCANDFNIWRFYATGVTAAAKGCGRDAVPDPADAASTPAAGASSSSTAAPAAPTTTPITSGAATSSVPPTQGSSTAAPPTSTTSSPTAAAGALEFNSAMALGFAGVAAFVGAF